MKKIFPLLIATLVFLVLSGDALAKNDKLQSQSNLTRQRAIAHMKRGMEQGYRELIRLYQSKSYPEFFDQVLELQKRLAQSSLPSKYQKEMALKINRLATKVEKVYIKEKKSRGKKIEKSVVSEQKKDQAKETKKKSTISDPNDIQKDLSKERKLEVSKADRDENTRRIRAEILAAYPNYRTDKTGLADAVIERKIKIVREREFLQSEFRKGVETLYQKAIGLYNNDEFVASQEDFQEVERLSPDYKSTRSYLKKLTKQTRPLNTTQSTVFNHPTGGLRGEEQ